MNSRFSMTAVVVVLALTSVFSTPGSARQPKHPVHEMVETRALNGSMLGDSAQQEILVFLPPSYYTSSKRYPVVYFLHGYEESPSSLTEFKDTFDTLMTEGKSKEFIVAAVNGANKFGGGFYVNSPVSGNWEDFIVKDAVAFVDAKYRTLAAPESRAITGFSMGGFGAVNLGLRHPEVYSVVYALCPGLLTETGLADALKSWDPVFLQAYGAAFAPRPDQPAPHAAILTAADLGTGNATETAWKSGYGDLKAKIARYLEQPIRLRKIRVDYGKDDAYRWIPEGSVYFARLLLEAGIPSEQVAYAFGHQLSWMAVEEGLVPFISAHIKTE